jgi:hypothetical protein
MPLFCQNLQQTADSALVCILPTRRASPVAVRRRPRKRKSTPVKPPSSPSSAVRRPLLPSRRRPPKVRRR